MIWVKNNHSKIDFFLFSRPRSVFILKKENFTAKKSFAQSGHARKQIQYIIPELPGCASSGTSYLSFT